MSRNSPMGIPCRCHFHIVKRHRRDYLKPGPPERLHLEYSIAFKQDQSKYKLPPFPENSGELQRWVGWYQSHLQKELELMSVIIGTKDKFHSIIEYDDL